MGHDCVCMLKTAISYQFFLFTKNVNLSCGLEIIMYEKRKVWTRKCTDLF